MRVFLLVCHSSRQQPAWKPAMRTWILISSGTIPNLHCCLQGNPTRSIKSEMHSRADTLAPRPPSPQLIFGAKSLSRRMSSQTSNETPLFCNVILPERIASASFHHTCVHPLVLTRNLLGLFSSPSFNTFPNLWYQIQGTLCYLTSLRAQFFVIHAISRDHARLGIPKG